MERAIVDKEWYNDSMKRAIVEKEWYNDSMETANILEGKVMESQWRVQ
jgi:hypothetical protein